MSKSRGSGGASCCLLSIRHPICLTHSQIWMLNHIHIFSKAYAFDFLLIVVSFLTDPSGSLPKQEDVLSEP